MNEEKPLTLRDKLHFAGLLAYTGLMASLQWGAQKLFRQKPPVTSSANYKRPMGDREWRSRKDDNAEHE